MNLVIKSRSFVVPVLCAATLLLGAFSPGRRRRRSRQIAARRYHLLRGRESDRHGRGPELRHRLIGESRVDAMTADMIDYFSELMGMDLNMLPQLEKLDADCKEWMGDEIGLVMGTGILKEEPDGAIVIEVSSAKKAEKEFPKLLDALKDLASEALASTQPGNMMG